MDDDDIKLRQAARALYAALTVLRDKAINNEKLTWKDLQLVGAAMTLAHNSGIDKLKI